MNSQSENTSHLAPWSRIGRPPTYQLVLERVREQLACQALRVGDALPVERRLAELLGASRPAVREAIRILQSHGIIGYTAAAVPQPALVIEPSPSEGFTTTLRLQLATRALFIEELSSTKFALEQVSIRTLAGAASPAVVEHLKSLITTLSSPGLPLLHRRQIDDDFHRTIATHDGNRMTHQLLEAITGIERMQHESLSFSLDHCHNAPVSDYQQIVDAIRARDPEQAATRLERHVRYREGGAKSSTSVSPSDVDSTAQSHTAVEEDG